MRQIPFIILLGLVAACAVKESQTTDQSYHIVPKPVAIVYEDRTLALTAIRIIADNGAKTTKAFLEEFLRSEGIRIADGGAALTLTLGSFDSLGVEGYTLAVNDDGISIKANSAAGLFYGAQTLVQMLTDDSGRLAYATITDYPRFPYRGLHLDVGRHMFSIAFIKKYIDLMARHKMNTFHWHLTEDQGWRIEIEKYPKLQEVAAYRDKTVIGRHSTRTRHEPRQYDGKRYGGYYTKAEIREVIDYAAARHVTIIPEIEMPGHAMAALAAYPELGCTGGPYKTATTWGIFPDVYCAGKETTFEFLQNVLDEVIELFPSKYIHIGGDEVFNAVFKTSWENCPYCARRMKAEGLKDAHELQSYFVQRIERYVNSKGRQIIGWDEILEGGLAPNATVMSWRGEQGGIEAVRQGHDVIMTPEDWFYLDHAQDTVGEEPVLKRGFSPISEVYAYDPMPESLTSEQRTHILGAQGNVWTEYMQTPGQVEYMTWPRACAIAEVVWTPKEDRDYRDFLARMKMHVRRLEDWDVNYSKHVENEFKASVR